MSNPDNTERHPDFSRLRKKKTAQSNSTSQNETNPSAEHTRTNTNPGTPGSVNPQKHPLLQKHTPASDSFSRGMLNFGPPGKQKYFSAFKKASAREQAIDSLILRHPGLTVNSETVEALKAEFTEIKFSLLQAFQRYGLKIAVVREGNRLEHTGALSIFNKHEFEQILRKKLPAINTAMEKLRVYRVNPKDKFAQTIPGDVLKAFDSQLFELTRGLVQRFSPESFSAVKSFPVIPSIFETDASLWSIPRTGPGPTAAQEKKEQVLLPFFSILQIAGAHNYVEPKGQTEFIRDIYTINGSRLLELQDELLEESTRSAPQYLQDTARSRIAIDILNNPILVPNRFLYTPLTGRKKPLEVPMWDLHSLSRWNGRDGLIAPYFGKNIHAPHGISTVAGEYFGSTKTIVIREEHIQGGVFLHELGHAFECMIRSAFPELYEPFMKKTRETFRTFVQDWLSAGKKIMSDTAALNDHELIAESFRVYFLNEELLRHSDKDWFYTFQNLIRRIRNDG